MLAVLLLEPGAVVPAHRMVDLVWGERAPATARKAIQVYVSRLRRALDGVPGVTLRTRGDGYCLDVHDEDVDVHRFRGLTEEAALAPPEAAEPLLAAAVALWRGEALADVDSDPLRRAVVEPLTEERLAAVENLSAVRLELGRHAEVVPDLSALVAEHPLREHGHFLLMRALHDGGRDAEALAVFEDLRARLADELGSDPGAALRRLHESILRGDAPPAAGNVQAPAQLPAGTRSLVGRDAALDRVTGELLRREGPRVVTLHGAGGLGKTELALHAAQRVREHFPDGQLYAGLGGMRETPATPGAVLGGFLRALGVPPRDLPEAEADRSAMYRTLTSGRRVLVVLDDARDSAQVRPLLPGGHDAGVLVTSRGLLSGLLDAVAVDAGLLSEEDAVTLLATVAGQARVMSDAAAALDIVRACGWLPLAIRIAGARLTARPDWRLADFAGRLADVRRMDELRAEDVAVRSSFALSYRQLDAEHARAFRLLAVAPGEDVGTGAAAALLQRPEPDAERLAEDLVDAGLLSGAGAGRYRFHDLMRLFAREKAVEDTEDTDTALVRLAGYYAGTARNALEKTEPGWLADPVDRPGAGPAASFDGEAAALEWLASEHDNAFATVVAAAELDGANVTTLAALVSCVGRYCDRRGLWEHWELAARAVRARAQREGNAAAEGTARRGAGTVLMRQDRLAEAEREFRLSLRLSAAGGNQVGEARASNALGLLNYHTGRYAQQLQWLRQAERQCRAIGNDRGVIVALNDMASAHLRLGTPELALPGLRNGLAMAREHGDSAAEMYLSNHLGSVWQALGEHETAVEHHTHALELARRSGYPEVETYALTGLGKAHRAAGRPEQAREYLEQASTLTRERGDAATRAWLLRVFADLLADPVVSVVSAAGRSSAS